VTEHGPLEQGGCDGEIFWHAVVEMKNSGVVLARDWTDLQSRDESYERISRPYIFSGLVGSRVAHSRRGKAPWSVLRVNPAPRGEREGREGAGKRQKNMGRLGAFSGCWTPHLILAICRGEISQEGIIPSSPNEEPFPAGIPGRPYASLRARAAARRRPPFSKNASNAHPAGYANDTAKGTEPPPRSGRSSARLISRTINLRN